MRERTKLGCRFILLNYMRYRLFRNIFLIVMRKELASICIVNNLVDCRSNCSLSTVPFILLRQSFQLPVFGRNDFDKTEKFQYKCSLIYDEIRTKRDL